MPPLLFSPTCRAHRLPHSLQQTALRTQTAFCLLLGGPFQGVLPDSQHPPAGPAQRPVHPPVPRHVRGEFLAPERPVSLRLRPMPGTPMPETPVHKHRQPQLGKNKVRTNCKPRAEGRESRAGNPPALGARLSTLDHQLHLPPPPRDPIRPEHPHQRQFRVRIPARPDARHNVAALGLGEHVRHEGGP